MALVSVGMMTAQTDKAAAAAAKEAAKALKAEIKAANKDLKTAQSVLATDGGNMDEAMTYAEKAMANPHTNGLAETWNTAGQIQKKIYDKENEKMYLQQAYSEDRFFGSLSKMFSYFQKCDEIEQQPNAKGKVVYKFRPINAELLNSIRPNLVSGGVTYFNNDKNEMAYQLFSQYIESAEYPMLSQYNIVASDTLRTLVAYYASLAGMKMEDYDKALKYIDMAVDNAEVGETAMTYKAMAYASKGDSLGWVNVLKEGVEKFPSKDYFYSNLISYYNEKGQNAELLAFANEMLAKNPQPIFVFVKGFLAQNDKDYDAAIEHYKKAIEMDPDYTGALRNIAICYVQKAQDKSDAISSLSMKSKEYKSGMEEEKEYYKLAMPIYQKLRALDEATEEDKRDPEVRTSWTTGLYTCYYMLNMGEELKEMEQILGL